MDLVDIELGSYISKLHFKCVMISHSFLTQMKSEKKPI